MASGFLCPTCNESFDNPFKRGQHVRYQHGGRAAAARKKKSEAAVTEPKEKPARGAESKFKDVIDRLQAKRRDIVKAFEEENEEIAAIDKAIAALEVLG